MTAENRIAENQGNTNKINAKTSLYAIIGSPVEHSLSPLAQNAGFAAKKLNSVFLAFETEEAGRAINAMKALSISGYSVTMPLKEKVIPFLDSLDSVAEQVGAVNCIVNSDGLLSGHNTDVGGAMRALKNATPVSGKKALLLGSGGAARAIAFGLKQESARIIVSNRTNEKAKYFAKELGAKQVNWAERLFTEYDILVNATSVGMGQDSANTPFPAESLSRSKVVFDAVHTPMHTRLLAEAKEKACITVSGVEMFLGQAFEMFEIFTGLQAPEEEMRQAVLKERFSE